MNTLRRLRIDKALTVEELSAKTGVTVTTIYNLERGDIRNPRVSTLAPLAEFFDVKPTALMPGVVVFDDQAEEAA